MTYEEAIKEAKLEYSLFPDDNEYLVNCIEALEKAEKYKWHDLRKNREDLPEAEKTVEIAFLNGANKPCTARAFYEDGQIYDSNSKYSWYGLDDYDLYNEELDDFAIPEGWFESVYFAETFGVVDLKVVAWRYIEPFKEDDKE